MPILHTSPQQIQWSEESVEQATALLKSMAHPSRLKTLYYLKDGEASVNELEVAIGISQSNMSQHLGHMRRAGLLKSRRNGAQVFYSIASHQVLHMLVLLVSTSETHVVYPEAPLEGDSETLSRLDHPAPKRLAGANYAVNFKG
jgi:DNA-binding transcriptional ArsR family regulator